jgi:uncharacterized membrane protein YvlD (DUF360 family)
VYGVYILLAPIIVAPSFILFGLMLGLPLTLVGFGLFAFALSLLLARKYRETKYSPRRWVPALLGAVAAGAVGYIVFALLRGI